MRGGCEFAVGGDGADVGGEERMGAGAEMVTAPAGISLQDANTLLWDRHVYVLPVIGDEGRLESLVLRRDYLMHKRFASESVDGEKRFLVAAGHNRPRPAGAGAARGGPRAGPAGPCTHGRVPGGRGQARGCRRGH